MVDKMNVIIMMLIISILTYTLSYAKYNWSIDNRLGALGLILLSATTLVLATYFLFVIDVI